MKKLKKFKYKTSKNYELLYELIKTQRIVCFVENKKGVDICANIPGNDCDIGVRGISYIYAIGNNEQERKKDFIKQCKEYNLEFIVP